MAANACRVTVLRMGLSTARRPLDMIHDPIASSRHSARPHWPASSRHCGASALRPSLGGTLTLQDVLRMSRSAIDHFLGRRPSSGHVGRATAEMERIPVRKWHVRFARRSGSGHCRPDGRTNAALVIRFAPMEDLLLHRSGHATCPSTATGSRGFARPPAQKIQR